MTCTLLPTEKQEMSYTTVIRHNLNLNLNLY